MLSPSSAIGRLSSTLPIFAVWFLAWAACCSLPTNPLLWLLPAGPTAHLLATALCLALVVIFAVARPQTWRRWFPPARKWTLAWGVVGLLAATVWLHYHLRLPWYVYVPWMATSVLWQQCTTFGWLYDELEKRLTKKWLHALLVTLAFVAGHVIILSQRFANPLAIAFVAPLGLLFWFLRKRTGSLHTATLLHCAFYFIAC